MIPVWAIGVIAAILLAGTVVPGIHLWWPTHQDPIRRSDLGLALMTGALIAFAVLIVQVLVDVRTRQDDRHRQAVAQRQSAEAEKQSLQISLETKDLSGINLHKAKLADFYLRKKDLDAANLEGAVLTRAVLTRANLARANLDGAQLSKANLSWANLTSATLDGANLTGAHLYGALLEGASLEGARLKGSFLTGASLSADLRRAKLNNAVLEGARFQGANLMGADLRYAWLVDANFDGAFLYGADFRNTGATLGYATLSGAVFNKTTTRWPEGFQLKAKCDGQRCVVQSTPAHQTDLTAFRATLARELPQGWKVNDRDPAGISVDARRKEAEFDGEVLPTKTTVNTPEDCVIAFEKNSMERFAWTQQVGRPRQTRFRGLRAIEREYLFRTSSRRGETGFAADVHYGRGKLCYRIEASTSRELFGTYLSDFRTLFGLLGAAGRPNGRTLDVFPAAE